jgi:membrane-associated phospholipid phosphatase
MYVAERLVATFFVVFLLAALAARIPMDRRLKSLGLGLIGLTLVGLVPLAEGWRGGRLTRDLLPSFLLLLTYWQTGQLVVSADPRFQGFLVRFDRRRFPRTVAFSKGVEERPNLARYLHASYLACYPMVPAGVAVLYLTGNASRVEMFWLVVLPPTLACHALTTVFRSVPPWALDPADGATAGRSVLEALNRWVTEHASIRANTFPSGHAASTAAVAFALWGPAPLWGGVFTGLAGSVALATVLLRYHYTLDTVLGIGLAMGSYALFG